MFKLLLKIFLPFTILPIVSLPISLGIKNIINQSTKNVNQIQNRDFENINYLFLNDIQNYNETNYMQIKTKIDFMQCTTKKSFIFACIPHDTYKTKNLTTYEYTNYATIDLEQMELNVELFPKSFKYTFFDPYPSWNDPAIAARWYDRTRTIHINQPYRNINNKLEQNKKWYGNELYTKIVINDNEWHDDGINLFYPNHNYFAYSILMFINGYYKLSNVNKEFRIKHVTNKNLPIAFINSSFSSFNENLSILITMNKAYNTLIYLNNFIKNNTFKGLWINKYISLEEVKNNINQIEHLSFNSYYDLNNLINNYINNKSFLINGNYIDNLNKLNNSLRNYNVINDINDEITINNVCDFYETILLFFKNNKIKIIDNTNNEYIVWNGLEFIINSNLNLANAKMICVERIEKNNYKLINDNFNIMIK